MMNKYLQKLVKNVRGQLEIWLNKQTEISHDDLYRFLHSIAGTASTIGFTKGGETARELMDQLDEKDTKVWGNEELQLFLMPLISTFYYEEFQTIEDVEKVEKGYNEKKLILLIDDDTTLLMYLKDELEKEDWVVMAIADSERAIASYYDLDPDCVIIDIHMKKHNGFDVLQILKEKMKQRFIPTIMISIDDTKKTRMLSYQLGADDFIRKPLEMDEFIVRIKRQLERKQSIDELILIDELTRVYNRKYLKQSYERLFSNLERRNECFSMVMIDLDNFKKVNDTYGHITGDKVLTRLADELRNGLRMSDIIIRYGGEEILILLPETDRENTRNIIGRILKSFSEVIFTYEDKQFSCTFSAGVHEVTIGEPGLQENIEKVDGALYKAKNNGKNQICLAVGNQVEAARKKLHIGIIDDDPIIRTMLVDLISKGSYKGKYEIDIQSFKDGMEFFDAKWHLNNEPYLIILDGIMPRMDGLEVLQKIRKLPNKERFTIMMLTSRNSEQDILRALQYGADDYITKPFKLLELEFRLNHLIKRMN